MTTQLSESRYVFDNESTHSTEQHRCLAAAYDPLTTSRLSETGVTDGWQCLEVGAGGGSVASWLAERVAPSGDVLATDIKVGHLHPAGCLRVLPHDVTSDPLPESAYDLIHARLVLLHLPERHAVLEKLVRALKPGGWLQLDEFDISYGPCLYANSIESRRRYEEFLAAKRAVMAAAGADGEWGGKLPAAMHAAGLTEIDTHPQLEVWHPDSPGLRLLVHHTFHLRDEFLAQGMTPTDLAAIRAVLAHPKFRACSCAMYSVRGRRPRQ